MKTNWTKNAFTFVIIPEAHRSVIRLRFPRAAVYTAAAALAISSLLGAALYFSQAKLLFSNMWLKSELETKTEHYERTLTGKDNTIEQLQNEVIALSRQAQEVEEKVNEMQKLEQSLRAMKGKGAPAVRAGEAAKASSGTAQGGQGGSMIPVTTEDIHRLSDDTKEAYTTLAARINGLHSTLSAARQEALNKERLMRITPSLWPVASRSITSGFGYRKDPFTQKSSFHKGIDIADELNAPVFVTADGVVTEAGSDKVRGKFVMVDHSNGIRTMYMHLNSVKVKTGDKLEKGQPIGQVGSTGRSTGPHLHYEVIKNGVSVNPKPYILTGRDS